MVPTQQLGTAFNVTRNNRMNFISHDTSDFLKWLVPIDAKKKKKFLFPVPKKNKEYLSLPGEVP